LTHPKRWLGVIQLGKPNFQPYTLHISLSQIPKYENYASKFLLKKNFVRERWKQKYKVWWYRDKERKVL